MKKILSVILAVVMLSTCLSSAFSVFAADNATDNADVKTLIENFSGDMTASEPTEEDLTAYNNMVNAYNALSAEEIEALDVFTFDKLLLAVYDREMALWKQENNSTSVANAYKAVHARAQSVITMPSYVETASELYTEAEAISTDAKAAAFAEKIKTAPLNAVILAGGYYKSYKAFRYSVSGEYGVKLIYLAANKTSSVTQKSDSANKPTAPKSVSKPSASKYELGADDPEYIAAYEAYLAYKEAYADYYVAKYAFEFAKHYLSALKTFTDAVPYFSFVYDICKNSIEAKRNFNESSDTEKIAEVLAVYNTLDDVQKTWFKLADGYAFAEKVLNSQGTEYTYNTYKIEALIEFCSSMEFFYTIKDFEEIVADITLPYTNSDIATAKETFSKIPESIAESVDADILAKYKDILASVGPDEASDAQPDLGAYTETRVSFNDISEKNAKMLANAVIEVVLSAAGVSDFKNLINTKVLTNSTVVSLAGLIYPLLADKTDGLINILPSDMTDYLTEEKFAGAVAALTAAGDDWDAVTVNSGDLGFEDGDVEGFLDAASAMLRGASALHAVLTLENTADKKNGTYTYGAYEELIEIFEILDLDAVMSSDEYSNYVNSAEIKNDAKFRAILAPIAYFLVELGNDPVNTICDALPKIAYAINSGIVNTRINNLLSMFQLISIGPVDLTTSGVYEILSKKLLVPNNIALSETEFSSLIADLAGCGTAVSKTSVKRGQSYRMGIESDRARTIVVLMTWILDVAGNNKELVNNLLDLFVSDNAFLKTALKLLINVSTKFIPRKVIFSIVTIFISLAKIFGGIFK